MARDVTCQFPRGCDRPATDCEPHHIKFLSEGGHSSTVNLMGGCWQHHHTTVHKDGWTIRRLGDGRLETTSPDGKIYRSPRPPPARPG
jgi:hypothetical protein